jgi:hypothetical protein
MLLKLIDVQRDRIDNLEKGKSLNIEYDLLYEKYERVLRDRNTGTGTKAGDFKILLDKVERRNAALEA